MIDQFTIQHIKETANVVDVISDFYELKHESGGTYTCLCPFHDDRHIGSFKVSATKNYYRCFSCGAHGGPVDFLIYHENMSFIEALRWLAVKYGISDEELDKTKTPPTICKAHTPPPPLPMLELPSEMVSKLKVVNTQPKRAGNGDTFCEWLRGLPWNEEERKRVDKVLKNYCVGHGKDGHTVFWQIDEAGKVRTGKMMLYKPDGHRDKESFGNFDFVHSRLKKAGYWSDEEYEVKTCFFGQHLLDFYPDATVNIVESEKTALICAIAYGDMEKHLWMATGGKSGLNAGKFEVFKQRGRFVVLYPDKDGAEDWQEMAKNIGYEKVLVNTSMMAKNWKPEDGPKADFADILTRRLRERAGITSREGLGTVTGDQPKRAENGDTKNIIELLTEQNPAFGLLVEKFDLIPE